MRRQVALLVAAVTSLVVLAFLVPFAVLLDQQATNRAVAVGLRDAQSLAAVVAALSDSPDQLELALQLDEQNAADTTVVLPDSTAVGAPLPGRSPALALAQRGSSFVADAPGGREVLVAVAVPDGTAVVRSFVPSAALHRGVGSAIAVLGVLGLVLLVVAVLVADRLARTFVRPVSDLAATTRALAAGDLEARVVPAGPREVHDVGVAVNQLGHRIGELLDAERETVADLSHRLRTPLTALRLEADSPRVVAGLDVLERVVDDVIRSARRSVREGVHAVCDAVAVVRERTAFWAPLVEDQSRALSVEVPAGPLPVRLVAEDLAAALDALIENVLSHTPDGTDFAVALSPAGATVSLVVSDRGPGLAPGSLERGRSGGGSTGLGLDIARRTAEAAGGELVLGTADGGGARIAMVLPLLDGPG